jgi:hypothetical protein
MAQKAPARTGAPNHLTFRRPINVTFTTHALHTLDVRGIKVAEVRRALEDDPVQVSTDQKTGNTVYTTSNFKVVARDNNDDLLVVTVMNVDELNNVK